MLIYIMLFHVSTNTGGVLEFLMSILKNFLFQSANWEFFFTQLNVFLFLILAPEILSYDPISMATDMW